MRPKATIQKAVRFACKIENYFVESIFFIITSKLIVLVKKEISHCQLMTSISQHRDSVEYLSVVSVSREMDFVSSTEGSLG